jgi:hypothetical protein
MKLKMLEEISSWLDYDTIKKDFQNLNIGCRIVSNIFTQNIGKGGIAVNA